MATVSMSVREKAEKFLQSRGLPLTMLDNVVSLIESPQVCHNDIEKLFRLDAIPADNVRFSVDYDRVKGAVALSVSGPHPGGGGFNLNFHLSPYNAKCVGTLLTVAARQLEPPLGTLTRDDVVTYRDDDGDVVSCTGEEFTAEGLPEESIIKVEQSIVYRNVGQVEA
jgi:hypothetical protein